MPRLLARLIAACPLLFAGLVAAPDVAGATGAAPDSLVVGVFPFAAERGDTLLGPLAYGLADLLSTDIARSRRLTVVERAQLGAILREIDLGASGAVDPATAPRAGRLIAARRVVVGSLRRRGDRDIVFEARVADVESGRVDTALVASASLVDVLSAEKAIAHRLFESLGIVLTPQERALVDQRPTANLAALLAYGQAVQAEVDGQYAAAARAFRRAAAADPGFTHALSRAQQARGAATGGSVGAIVDRVNRPLETNATTIKSGLATDPAFPSSQATIIVRITRP